MPLSDAALVEQCLEGRKDAFERIVKRYQHRIYGLALVRMKDRFEADDLAQETFLRAYQKLYLYDPERNFRNWLFTICVNLGKNRLRGRSRRREVSEYHLKNSASNVEKPMGNSDRMDLAAALHAIPEKFRVPLVLKHAEGFSYEEIGAIMKISPSAAKMRVKRARDRIISHL